jgi:hypothetical protein
MPNPVTYVGLLYMQSMFSFFTAKPATKTKRTSPKYDPTFDHLNSYSSSSSSSPKSNHNGTAKANKSRSPHNEPKQTPAPKPQHTSPKTPPAQRAPKTQHTAPNPQHTAPKPKQESRHSPKQEPRHSPKQESRHSPKQEPRHSPKQESRHSPKQESRPDGCDKPPLPNGKFCDDKEYGTVLSQFRTECKGKVKMNSNRVRPLIRKVHPDKNRDCSDKATEITKLINEWVAEDKDMPSNPQPAPAPRQQRTSPKAQRASRQHTAAPAPNPPAPAPIPQPAPNPPQSQRASPIPQTAPNPPQQTNAKTRSRLKSPPQSRTVEELLPSPTPHASPIPPTQRVSRRMTIFKSKRHPKRTTRTTGRTQRRIMDRRRLDTVPMDIPSSDSWSFKPGVSIRPKTKQGTSRRMSIFKSKRRPSKTSRTTGRTQRHQIFMTRRRLDTIPERTPSDRMEVI